MHTSQEEGKVFEEGSWGAQIFEGMEPVVVNGDVVVAKHWSSSLVSPFLCFPFPVFYLFQGVECWLKES